MGSRAKCTREAHKIPIVLSTSRSSWNNWEVKRSSSAIWQGKVRRHCRTDSYASPGAAITGLKVRLNCWPQFTAKVTWGELRSTANRSQVSVLSSLSVTSSTVSVICGSSIGQTVPTSEEKHRINTGALMKGRAFGEFTVATLSGCVVSQASLSLREITEKFIYAIYMHRKLI